MRALHLVGACLALSLAVCGDNATFAQAGKKGQTGLAALIDKMNACQPGQQGHLSIQSGKLSQTRVFSETESETDTVPLSIVHPHYSWTEETKYPLNKLVSFCLESDAAACGYSFSWPYISGGPGLCDDWDLLTEEAVTKFGGGKGR